MAKAILVDYDFGGSARPTNLPNAAGSTDAVPFGQLKALLEGNNWKDNVRVASTTNINLAAPGATIDTITMVANDRFLAKDQTTQSQNGIYIWNGAAVAATRAADADTFDELESAVVRVDGEAGASNGGTKWAQTQVNGVIGTNNVIFVSDSGSAPAASETTSGIAEIATQAETDAGTDDLRMITPLKFKNSKFFNKMGVATIGDGSATSFVLTHNLNTRDVIVQVFRNSAPYDSIECDQERTSVNTVTLKFLTAPASTAYRAVVSGTQG